MFDLLIKNAIVIDGTASHRKKLDLAVIGERITEVKETITANAKEVIDAQGLIVCPGFIDAHTHDDRLLLSNPQMDPKVSQGVTTVVGGNCGVSLAPLKNIDPPVPLNLLGGQEWYRFNSVKEYREELEIAGIATNCAMLVGHSTLRTRIMNDLTQAATESEIDNMKETLVSAMEDGCIGMSTGLAYPAAMAAPTSEVVALAKNLKVLNGIYATHMRDEGEFLLEAVEETLSIGEQAEVPVIISHHKTVMKKHWGKTKRTLEMINKARKNQMVHFDVYPYIASSSVLIKEFIDTPDTVKVTWSESCPEMNGKYLHEVMQLWDCDIDMAVEKLMPAGAIYFEIDEMEMQNLLRQPQTMIGSDGLPHDKMPHPRLWGTFPRVVGYYARELGLFSMEQAIHQMTGLTASVFGLDGRGVIKIGNYADLVVFDSDAILDIADFDDPIRPSAGIHYVLVNGEQVWNKQGVTDNRPGRWLK